MRKGRGWKETLTRMCGTSPMNPIFIQKQRFTVLTLLLPEGEKFTLIMDLKVIIHAHYGIMKLWRKCMCHFCVYTSDVNTWWRHTRCGVGHIFVDQTRSCFWECRRDTVHSLDTIHSLNIFFTQNLKRIILIKKIIQKS